MASDIAIIERKVISYMLGPFWDKVIDFENEPVVQCDAPAVKDTSLGDDANGDNK